MVNNNMRTLSVFSTWHPIGYKKYGDHFIQGFLQNWPTEVQLSIYAEDHEPNTYNADNIEVLDQRSTLPDLKAWQEKHKDNGPITRLLGIHTTTVQINLTDMARCD